MENLYISKSKIRRDLLALFFTNTSQKYYLRELERLLGYSAGNIRRELLKYQSDGLFLTSRTGNLLFYYLNTNHPLYEELKSIVSKTVGVEDQLKKLVSSAEGVRISFVYGSFASNSEKASSDIDVMIIGEPDLSFLNEKIANLEKKLRREINLTIYSWEEFIEKKKVGRAFIQDLLNRPKIMLFGREDDL